MTNPAAKYPWHWLEPDWDDHVIQKQVEIAIASGRIKPPSWSGTIKPYQGATPQERINGWKITKCAILMGLLPEPTMCSVCGTTQRTMESHTEDYSRPIQSKPICRSCHRILHNRFKNPERWKAFVDKHAYPEAWFTSISLQVIMPE